MPKRLSLIGCWQGMPLSQIYAQKEAIAAYTRALELSKEITISSEQLHHLYTHRGRAMELIGQFEQALKNYDEMVTTAREHVIAAWNWKHRWQPVHCIPLPRL